MLHAGESNYSKECSFSDSTYECQFRFMTPTTRPDGRHAGKLASPFDPRLAVLGASSALPGTRWTSSSSSSSERIYSKVEKVRLESENQENNGKKSHYVDVFAGY